MNQNTGHQDGPRSAKLDGLAAVAIILLTMALIVFVVSSLL